MADEEESDEEEAVKSGLEATLNVSESQKIEPPKAGFAMEDLAKVLGHDPDGFITLYNADYESWKNMADSLYASRMEKTLREMDKLKESKDIYGKKENLWERMVSVSKAFVDYMGTDRNNLEDVAKAHRRAMDALPKAIKFTESAELFRKQYEEYEDLLHAKASIEYYYAEAVKDMYRIYSEKIKSLADVKEHLKKMIDVMEDAES